MTSLSLSNGSLLRTVRRQEDLQPVTKLIYQVCEYEGDTTVATSAEELEHAWNTPGFDPAVDACLVEAPDGRLLGYGEFSNESAHADLRYDLYALQQPGRNEVLGAVVDWLDRRAAAEEKLAAPGLRVTSRSSMDGKDQEARQVHEARGYVPIRYFWRMEIRLDAPPPAPVFPQGIELRPFVRELHEKVVWEAENEAFRDHWGSHDHTFEEWTERRFGHPNYDPSLWVIAWDGDQVAGFSINRYRMGIGWIGTLGVRRPWRKSGLGLALLRQSFGEYYRRGQTVIGLGVDASNPTGATRLYQRAGMNVASEFISYEKELRPGTAPE